MTNNIVPCNLVDDGLHYYGEWDEAKDEDDDEYEVKVEDDDEAGYGGAKYEDVDYEDAYYEDMKRLMMRWSLFVKVFHHLHL